MSAEKKVILLFLSLIVLMAVCVNTHLDTIKLSTYSEAVVEAEIVEPKKEEVVKEEAPVEVESTQKVESTEETSETENPTTQAENNTNEEATATTEENNEEVVEEKIEEEPAKPLVETDKRYTRIGNEKNIEDLSKEAQLLQLKMTEYVKENPIIFKRGSNNITKKSAKTISSVVEALKEFPNIKIEVAGHTDAIGAKKLNQSISYQRAKSVRDRLIKLGIEKSRIKARGYGESIPLVKNSPKGYSKVNRRVEFNIIEE